MNASALLYLGALLPFGWGIAHLFPTRNVVRGFGAITLDNRRIITMEWVTEGLSLIFIGVLVALVTYVDRGSTVSHVVYWTSFVVLNAFSVLSFFTGFRVAFAPFKLCPVIFTTSSVLILVGTLTG